MSEGRYATIIETAAFAKALRGIRTPLMSALAFDRLNTVRREGIPDDPMPLLPKEGFDWWCLNIKWRTDHQFDAVVLITGETGSGKCWGRGSAVLMFNGDAKPVEDVAVGDLLMGPDSQPRTVRRLWRGRSEMRRIVPARGMEPFVVTPEHKLVLRRGNVIREIEVNRLPKYHAYKLFGTGVEFSSVEPLPLDPYLLGVILGSGYITTADTEIVDYCRQWAKTHGMCVTIGTKRDTPAVTVRIIHQPILLSADDRRKRGRESDSSIAANGRQKNILGLLPIECHERFIPRVFLLASRIERQRLLAGLLDTDGYLIHHMAYYTSKSSQLAEDVAFLARSLGLSAFVRAKRKRCQTGAVGTYFEVSMRGAIHEIPMRVERKRKMLGGSRPIADSRGRPWKNPTHFGFHIETLPEDDYYGIEVDGDHRHLMANFMVASNSTLGLRLLQHLDPTFTLEARLCYTAAELLAIYQTIKPGQGVLFDEGVRGLLAGDQMTKEQKALIQALALIREKGAILAICAPSIWNIAKQVRQDRARFWIHVLHRGLATMHEREAYLHYVPDPKLGFMQSAHCPWLTWKAYPPNSKFFQHYREVKTMHLDAYLQETRAILEGKGKGRRASLPPTPTPRDPPVMVTERAAAVLTTGLQPKSAPMQATDDDVEAALRAMPVYKIPAFLHVGASRVSRVKRVRKIPDYQE